MGYADRFYYGQCKLEVVTNKTNVEVTDGDKKWESTGSQTFMLPGSSRYIVKADNIIKEVFANYGSYIRVEI